MNSTAKDVVSYIEEVPADRRASLIRLRELCLETLTGYEECMDYGMPTYKKAGNAEVAFASQKNYISLYILKEAVVQANRHALPRGVGKSCIKYTRPDKIDFDVVAQLLAGTRDSAATAC